MTLITELQYQKRQEKYERDIQATQELRDLNLSVKLSILEKSWGLSTLHLICTCLFCGEEHHTCERKYKQSPYCLSCHKKEQKEHKRYEAELNFNKRSEEIHGDKYPLGSLHYINASTDIWLFCKKHNKIFPKSPNNHISKKQGCPDCALERVGERYVSERAKTFFDDAQIFWDTQFDYTVSEYKGAHTDIWFRCNICNTLQRATPSNHIHKTNPTGCTGCKGSMGKIE